MVVKTADGWKSKSHYKSQEKAWRKARSKLQEMVGEECMSSKAKLSEKAETIFKSIDTDNSGGLDVPELKACFEKAGVELTQSEALAMVSGADEDGNGTLDLWEFKKLLDQEVKRWQAQQTTSVCAIL